MKCKVNGCGRDKLIKDMCKMHYNQTLKYGRILDVLKNRICIAADCRKEFKPKKEKQEYCCSECRSINHPGTDKHKVERRKLSRTPKQKQYQYMLKRVKYKFRNEILSCSVEGCENKDIEKHHKDYSRPFDITPLCQKHHRKLHMVLRKSKLRRVA